MEIELQIFFHVKVSYEIEVHADSIIRSINPTRYPMQSKAEDQLIVGIDNLEKEFHRFLLMKSGSYFFPNLPSQIISP